MQKGVSRTGSGDSALHDHELRLAILVVFDCHLVGVLATDLVRKKHSFLSDFEMQTINLPRQARDRQT